MGKISKEEFLRRVEATPEVEPDEWDLKMLASIKAENDTSHGRFLQMDIKRNE
jgi:hypothetical protein